MSPLKTVEAEKTVLQGVRTAALNQVEEFCKKNGVEPGDFMSNRGWLRDKSWKGNVDWKNCVNWKKFGGFVMGKPAARSSMGPVKKK
ncbi:MAG TPA: hypothetical protein VLD37_01875 [Candidatus Bilamarchaeum sp.]|nr:hypothetical protein [Candidatus Bilamarchaeum sp.]